jgi:hypothetical protein
VVKIRLSQVINFRLSLPIWELKKYSPTAETMVMAAKEKPTLVSLVDSLKVLKME